MAEVRGDSRICIKKGDLKTVIAEEDYERGGYKKAGWVVVKEDWTKDRVIKPPVDYTQHLNVNNITAGSFRKK